MSPEIPVIFLAFANDRADGIGYLRNLPEEARQLRNALQSAHQAGQCEVVVRQNATLQDVLDIFQLPEHRDRIAVFHFGGHANGYSLLLEAATGDAAIAHAQGLAGFLGQQRGLKFVFLNGCSTQQQVDGLRAVQIPAIIATAQAIDDDVATEFAGRLYRSLASGATLGTAYREAQSAVELRWGSGQRGLYFLADENDPVPEQWPWDLYLQRTDETAADWKLPPPPEPEAPSPEPAPVKSGNQIGGFNISGISGSSINIGGSVSTNVQAGGDIVGGDKITTETAPDLNSSQAQLEAALARWQTELTAIIASLDDEDDQDYVEKTAAKVVREAAKGKAADPAKIEGLFKRLGTMAPDIIEVTTATLQNPFKGVGLVLEKINDRLKLERVG